MANRTRAPYHTNQSGKRLFRDETDTHPGTAVVAEDMNAVQNEILSFIRGFGITPNADREQVATILLRLLGYLESLESGDVVAQKTAADNNPDTTFTADANDIPESTIADSGFTKDDLAHTPNDLRNNRVITADSNADLQTNDDIRSNYMLYNTEDSLDNNDVLYGFVDTTPIREIGKLIRETSSLGHTTSWLCFLE